MNIDNIIDKAIKGVVNEMYDDENPYPYHNEDTERKQFMELREIAMCLSQVYEYPQYIEDMLKNVIDSVTSFLDKDDEGTSSNMLF